MNPILVRALGCLAALTVSNALFPGALTPLGALWATFMLTILYTVIRPLLLAVALPFNLLLFGLLTPLADALLIRWTAAWVGGFDLPYWPCVAVAVMISVAYWPYARWKGKRTTTFLKKGGAKSFWKS